MPSFPLHQRNLIIHSVYKFTADEMSFQYFRQHLFHLVSCQAQQGYFQIVNPQILLADFALSYVQSDQACFSRIITFKPPWSHELQCHKGLFILNQVFPCNCIFSAMFSPLPHKLSKLTFEIISKKQISAV